MRLLTDWDWLYNKNSDYNENTLQSHANNGRHVLAGYRWRQTDVLTGAVPATLFGGS